MPLIYYIQFLNRVYPNNRCDYTLKVVVKLTLSVELEGWKPLIRKPAIGHDPDLFYPPLVLTIPNIRPDSIFLSPSLTYSWMFCKWFFKISYTVLVFLIDFCILIFLSDTTTINYNSNSCNNCNIIGISMPKQDIMKGCWGEVCESVWSAPLCDEVRKAVPLPLCRRQGGEDL
jgi:hypothetical protein